MIAVSNSSRTSFIQNFAASAVFLFLLIAQLLAYLLYLFPASELLWYLCIPFNRIASPILYAFDMWTGFGVLASVTMLAVLGVFPLIAHLRRSWLATAVSGHVAFGVCAVLTLGAMKRGQTGLVSASLSPTFYPSSLDMSSMSLAVITLAMIALCVVNHIVFFARVRVKSAA